ncbi:hypothetical protein [Rhodopseudomonas sp. P2A-2r]|uniref:hypothetical protein n=1 Tax=unclassified Rhodopseudomonas TaxID=2638247 RepID=UPI0039B6F65C
MSLLPGLPRSAALLGVAIAMFGGVCAQAQTFSSAYSSASEKDCRKIAAFKVDDDDYASERVCAGPKGLVVLKQEDDMRETVSVGRTAKAAGLEPAAGQGFGPFNSTTDTVEWRLNAKGKPFAMILRWHIADNNDPDKNGRPQTKQMLVVTRLPPGAACHVAYVDVTANPDANDLARKAADEGAKKFDCRKDRVAVLGSRGRAIELAMPR